MTRVYHRFYCQITYDDQLQAHVFVVTRALVPARNSTYIISMNQQTEILDTIWRLGNLDKVRQKIVNGQLDIFNVRM